MSGNYWTFERDSSPEANEYVISEHRSRSSAVHAALHAFAADRSQTYGVDHRDDDGELIAEIGVINRETGGEFVEHQRWSP